MITGVAYNTLAPDQQTELCNNATQRKCFALLTLWRITSTLQRCLVFLCTLQIIMDQPQNRRERQTDTHTLADTQRECVCMSVCYQLSRSHWLPRFWTKFSGFSGSPGCHPAMSSQVQLPLVWVKIHPLSTACSVLLWKTGWIFTQDICVKSCKKFI